MGTLNDIIAGLKKKQVEPQARISEPYPVEIIVRMYYKAKKVDVYIEDLAGLRAMKQFVGQIYYPLIPSDELEIYKRKAKLVASFELEQVARILGTNSGVILWIIMHSTI